ncbi:MAG: ADP-ribosylglycohydrolase family protein [Desulfobacteraceae bacterium]|jgi:ADP-ribosylglycohydrolase|nr:ADP-ribosylglycohydrolase family protein [Desulfobacteraceae bacterium]
MMEDKAKAMVMASFAADSLALGVHWISDPKSIESQFGRVESLLKPSPDSYHPARDKGEFTHYGDQMLILLESIAETGSFDLADFSSRWQKLFDGYDGYVDGATKNTLANYQAGKPPENAGSRSDDMAGAARIAPLVCIYRDNPETLAKNAIVQTRMTHTDPATVESAEYFARVTQAVLKGAAPIEAMKSVAQDYFDISMVSAWLQKGLATIEHESIEAIGNFGQSCHTGEMFPGVVHLIAKYETNLKEALVQCVMAGGDSAARSALVGMVLGAHLGMEAIPRQWVEGMKAREKIVKWQ